MGSVKPYATAKGKRYMVQYRKPDRSATTKRGFRTKREAELYLAATEFRKASGDWIDSSASRITVGELAESWLASQTHLKPSSFHVLKISWRVHVEPVWGTRRIGEIQHSEVQDWVSRLSLKKSATVVIRAYGILASVIDRAVRDRRLSQNVARGVNLPRKKRKPRSYLNHVQVKALADQSGANETLILFLAYTGLRWGEAVGLRVNSVDLQRQRVLVRENAVNVAGTILSGSPKSHESRSVPFPRFLGSSLAGLCKNKPPTGLVFGDGENFMPTPTHGDGWFAGARNRAHIADSNFPRALTLHDLRHTAASLAISAGANVKAVQRMLGHASAAMTLDTYADLFDDDLDAVAIALDSARSASIEVKMSSKAEDTISNSTGEP